LEILIQQKLGIFLDFFFDELFGGSQYFMKFLGFVHFSSSHREGFFWNLEDVSGVRHHSMIQ